MEGAGITNPVGPGGDLPMRPFYIIWSFNAKAKIGFMVINQRGEPEVRK
jgi:hypothetical protein